MEISFVVFPQNRLGKDPFKPPFAKGGRGDFWDGNCLCTVEYPVLSKRGFSHLPPYFILGGGKVGLKVDELQKIV
jgi:hypothetical protein